MTPETSYETRLPKHIKKALAEQRRPDTPITFLPTRSERKLKIRTRRNCRIEGRARRNKISELGIFSLEKYASSKPLLKARKERPPKLAVMKIAG